MIAMPFSAKHPESVWIPGHHRVLLQEIVQV